MTEKFPWLYKWEERRDYYWHEDHIVPPLWKRVWVTLRSLFR